MIREKWAIERTTYYRDGPKNLTRNPEVAYLVFYFFMIPDLGTASFGNGSFFTQLKENSALITHFGLVYIDFYEHPPYSGTTSDFF